MAGVRDNTVTNVSTGSIASFKSVGNVPLKSLKVNFNPIQEGEGDPSPSNIRPITGWTGLNIYHTNKNLLNSNSITANANIEKFSDVYQNTNVDTRTNLQIAIQLFKDTSTFIKTATTIGNISTGRVSFSFAVDTLECTQICFKHNGLTRDFRIFFPFNLPLGTYIISLDVLANDPTSVGGVKWTNFQLELNSVATSYEPYNGSTVPVSWSSLGTVYGGYVDLIKGKLVEKYGVADIGSFDYSLNTALVGVDRYVAQKPSNCKNITNSQTCPNLISDIYGVEAIYEANDNYSTWITTIFNGYIYFYVPANTYSSAEEFKTAMSGHKVYYELTTPVEYDIDPITIKSLIGQNNIWSNADSVEALYCALESLLIYKLRFKTNQPHLLSASGNIASFNTDMVAPLKECKVYFEPVQASGTPSPDNVLPITGWNNLEVYRTSKNIRNWTITDTTIPLNYGGGTGNFNGFGNTYWDNYWIIPESLLGKTLTYSVEIVRAENPTNEYAEARCWTYTSSGVYTKLFTPPASQRYLTGSGRSTLTFTVPENTGRLALGILAGRGDRIYNPIVSIGSTAVEYELYNGTTTSITLPSTFYGGYVDLIKGELVATYGYKKFIGNEDWYISGGISNYCATRPTYLNLTPAATGSGGAYYLNPISDKLKGQAAWATYEYYCTINDAGHFYFGAPEELSTKAAVNAWIQEIGGIEVAYPLRTPVTYQLTPEQIKTLKGLNNIWSNTNGITLVKYWTHGSIADKRKVVWNQYAPQLTSNNWKSQNINYTSLNFDNNILTITITQNVTAVYQSSVITINSNYPWILNHKYYIKQEINPSEASSYVLVRNNDWAGSYGCPANKWTVIKSISSYTKTTANNYIFIGYCANSNLSTIGKTTKVKNPILIDLTQMFGEGNEPSTADEFEALCSRNGIDLTQPQPYNEGTLMYWYF